MTQPPPTDKPIERLIVHIGKRKTGSTSIQDSIVGYDRDGVRYADLGAPNHSGKLDAILSPQRMRRVRHQKTGESAADFAAFQAGIARRLEFELSQPRKVLIFSAESLELLKPDEIRRLKAMMHAAAREVRIVVFVRPYFAALVSGFQQQVKVGYDKPHLRLLPYESTIGSYIEIFGREAVTIVPFEPKAFVGGSLLRTFLTACGLPDLEIPEVRANESMSDAAVKMLYALNRYSGRPFETPEHYRAHRTILRDLSEAFQGPKFTLTPAAADRSVAQPEIEWTKAVLGLDFSGELPAMSPDEGAASAAFLEQMGQIDPASTERLIALVEAETGRRTADVPQAMRALFDTRLAALRSGGLRALRQSARRGGWPEAPEAEERRAQKAAQRGKERETGAAG